ncbi:MAG: TIGR02710 family CRISPR-associated CARF protein [Thermodesulfobacteriota bacterium]|nr:TIGR02710 family CRISPR-associated CARF protein [Thermodesulfobacteriota bacterium]
MPEKHFKAMVVSVGGTPSPIIFSLNKSKPQYICFFISKQTKKMMEDEILPNLDFKPRHHDWIMTPNADLLSDCYSKLARDLPALLEKWEVESQDVCVDYTGGTKTMSAALVLATIEKSCCYSYVGGDERSKGGVGVVLDGKERMWFLDNPWDQIATAEKKEVSILFNKARYASAAEVLERCISRVSKEQKPLFKSLREMVVGYDLWDRFKHSEAKIHLFKSQEVMTAISSENREIKGLVNHLEANLLFLEKLLKGEKPSSLYFRDILSNARRRAELEHKFDDAVARLYRGIEVLAQWELKASYDIDTSNVKAGSIPESLRQEFIIKYQSREDSRIRVPLYASFQLLRELGSDLARGFFRAYEMDLRPLLDIRNSSILAHGFIPVERKTYQRLWEAILQFSGTHEEDLPRFPFMKI